MVAVAIASVGWMLLVAGLQVYSSKVHEVEGYCTIDRLQGVGWDGGGDNG